jgi:hypothetical protein
MAIETVASNDAEIVVSGYIKVKTDSPAAFVSAVKNLINTYATTKAYSEIDLRIHDEIKDPFQIDMFEEDEGRKAPQEAM